MNKVIGIIPARFSSERLPGKPLIDIEGKSLIHRVWENIAKCDVFDELYIAIDDQRVEEECKSFGAKYVMTDPELPSGTDRINQALERANLVADIIVNVQGDEPMLNPESVKTLVEKFIESNADVGTLRKKIDNFNELFDPNIVKVVCDNKSRALYFSRNVIPFVRDVKPIDWINKLNYYKHIGIYVYRREALELFATLPQSPYEKAEKLEQLRLLYAGANYLCIETDKESIGVDTITDLAVVREMLKRQN